MNSLLSLTSSVTSLDAALVFWRTKNLLATIIIGMAAYWLWGSLGL